MMEISGKKYQIWSFVNDEGMAQPMFKEFETDDINELMPAHDRIAATGVLPIIVFNVSRPIDMSSAFSTNNTPIHIGEEEMGRSEQPWIYESPDGGRTIYRRRSGSSDREQVN